MKMHSFTAAILMEELPLLPHGKGTRSDTMKQLATASGTLVL